MRRAGVCFFVVLLLLAACSAKPAASSDSPGGTWSGDYGVNSSQRDPIRVDLRWEDAKLSGVVFAGPRSLPLTQASFKPDSGAISMEFETQGNSGQTIHYTIEGKISGNVMSGTWNHDSQRGDFRVTRQ
jgi:hypothetical protein